MSPVLAGEFFTTGANWECVDNKKQWKILKEMGIPDRLTCLLRNLYLGKKQQLEWEMEWLTGSRLRKEYNKSVYCHPIYLTYMQNTSWEMLGQMNHKLESKLVGGRNINNRRHGDDATLMAESKEELKNLLLKLKKENEKIVLKLNIKN